MLHTLRVNVQRFLALVISFGLLLMSPGVQQFVIAQATEEIQQQEVIEELESLFNALEAVSKEIPRDTFDLFEVVFTQADPTPEGVFTWVRDNTYLVPYQGALRGSQGVLMDRLGNSLDRALLLQELLQLSGYDTQLARAQLNESQAQNILDQARPIPAEGALPQTAEVDINTELQKYATEYGLDQEQLMQTLEQSQQQREDLLAEMRTRVESQTEFLMEALGSPTGDIAAEKAQNVAALQDHWWVQYKKDKEWIDLDPTFPNAEVSQKIVAANEVLFTNSLSDLPQDLVHRLQIRIVLECITPKGLQETILLESPSLIPADLLGQYIALQHVPVNIPQVLDISNTVAAKELILDQDNWFPVLTVGSQQIFTHDYTSSCKIGTATPPSIGKTIGGVVEGVTDLFGDLGDSFSSTHQTNETVTAQWLEYIIYVPGKTEQVIRRQIFDLLGPAARNANISFTPSDEQNLTWRLSLLGKTEILPLFSQFSADFIDYLTAERWLAQKQNIFALLQDSNANFQPLPPVLSNLYTLALVRSQWHPHPNQVHLGQINILSEHIQVKLNQNSKMVLLQGFDIVANQVEANPKLLDLFTAQLSQGILDTNAESLLGMSICQDNTQSIFCTDNYSVAETFMLSQQQEIEWLMMQNTSDVDLKTTLWSEDALARMRQDIVNDHYTVIAPTQPIKFDNTNYMVWWRVNPQTGEILGFGENGWGVTWTEYTMHLAILSIIICIKGADATNEDVTKTAIKCGIVGLAAYAHPAETTLQVIVLLLGSGAAGYGL